MDSFDHKCGRIERAVERLRGYAGTDDGGSATAVEILRRLRQEPFRVLVIGEFSRGKSTFINALVGEKILPSSVRPTTAVITVLHHGEQRRATLHWREPNRPPEVIELGVGTGSKDLDGFVSTKNAAWNEVAKVDITLPLRGLGLPFELVDTPGVNDIDTQREEITYGYLSRADAAIMLLDLHQPFSGSERRFLVDKVLAKDLSRLLFVVNKIDQEAPEKLSRALDYVHKRLAEVDVCRESPVLPLAAKLALLGKLGDPQALAQSRFPEFEKHLRLFLERGAGKSRVDTATRRIARIADDLAAARLSLATAIESEAESLRATVEESRARHKGAVQATGRIEADTEVARARYVEEATRAVQDRLAMLRRETKALMATESFPDEASIAAVRDALNRGVRELVAIPQATAHQLLGTLCAKHSRPLRAAPLLAPGDVPGIELRVSASDSSASSSASGIGAAIGGLLGAALLGPIGAGVGGLLGAFLGKHLTDQPDAPQIRTSVAESLQGIDGRARQAIEQASHQLAVAVNEEVIVPQRLAAEHLHRATAELEAATSRPLAERRNRATALRTEAHDLAAIVDELRLIGGTD
ncbi:MAG: dynamin family protein [Deltaproteobacteria bacterium]|nr:dynamin family protein [Deltaproteobacteria bacterium]